MRERPDAKASGADAPESSESLPVLIGRLGDDLSELVDSKLGLFRIELQEEVRSYALRGLRTIAGGAVAAVGVGLLSAGAAFFVSSLLRQAAQLSSSAAYALGFAAVGLLFLIAGTVVALRAGRALIAGAPTARKGD